MLLLFIAPITRAMNVLLGRLSGYLDSSIPKINGVLLQFTWERLCIEVNASLFRQIKPRLSSNRSITMRRTMILAISASPRPLRRQWSNQSGKVRQLLIGYGSFPILLCISSHSQIMSKLLFVVRFSHTTEQRVFSPNPLVRRGYCSCNIERMEGKLQCRKVLG